MSTRIALVDHLRLRRDALAVLLTSEEFEVSGCLASLGDAEPLLANVDVVVLVCSGCEIEDIQKFSSPSKLLVLSDTYWAMDASQFEAGAVAGIAFHDLSAETLFGAIRCVADRGLRCQ